MQPSAPGRRTKLSRRAAAGRPFADVEEVAAAFARATGAWIAALAHRGTADDPRAGELMAAVAAMPGDAPSAPFFALAGLFPDALAHDPAWRAAVDAAIEEFRA